MERAPYNGDVLFLQLQEVVRNDIHVVDDILVDFGRSIDFFTGAVGECKRVIETGVVVGCLCDAFLATCILVTVCLGVEDGVFADLPVPCECRDAALVPQFFGHDEVVFGVAFKPAFFVATACGKEHVETAMAE